MPSKTIELQPVKIESFQVPIVGLTPLIVHRFPEKARREIEQKQQKKAKQAKAAREPEKEYLAACYTLPGPAAGERGAVYGIPAVWFKKAAVAACTWSDGVTKVAARGSFHVMAEADGLIRLDYKDMVMRCDPVTIGMGTRDLRYRPQFNDWSCTITVRYNAAAVTPEQIINLLNVAGFANGLGEWRTQHDGDFGQFQVGTNGHQQGASTRRSGRRGTD